MHLEDVAAVHDVESDASQQEGGEGTCYMYMHMHTYMHTYMHMYMHMHMYMYMYASSCQQEGGEGTRQVDRLLPLRAQAVLDRLGLLLEPAAAYDDVRVGLCEGWRGHQTDRVIQVHPEQSVSVRVDGCSLGRHRRVVYDTEGRGVVAADGDHEPMHRGVELVVPK